MPLALPISSVPRLCVAVLILLLSVVVDSGCGGSSDGRVDISGEISLDGSPLSDGAIQFFPLDGQTSSSGAMIMEGKFDIPAEKGLLPGKYRVQITAPDEKAPPVVLRDPSGGPSLTGAPERIPPEYNVKSQQAVDVTEAGDNHFVYEIVGRLRK